MYLYFYIYRKRCVIQNWIMQLWRLTSSKTCKVGQQAGDPRELMVSSQFQSEGQVSRRTDGAGPVQRLTGSRPRKSQYFSSSLKAEKSWCPRAKAVRQEKPAVPQRKLSLFVLFRPSPDWMRPTCFGEGMLLFSVIDLNVHLI